MIARVISRRKMIRTLRISQRLIEIDDRVEMSRRPNPLIDRLPVGFVRRRRMIVTGIGVRQDRRADHLDMLRMRAGNDLFIRR